MRTATAPDQLACKWVQVGGLGQRGQRGLRLGSCAAAGTEYDPQLNTTPARPARPVLAVLAVLAALAALAALAVLLAVLRAALATLADHSTRRPAAPPVAIVQGAADLAAHGALQTRPHVASTSPVRAPSVKAPLLRAPSPAVVHLSVCPSTYLAHQISTRSRPRPFVASSPDSLGNEAQLGLVDTFTHWCDSSARPRSPTPQSPHPEPHMVDKGQAPSLLLHALSLDEFPRGSLWRRHLHNSLSHTCHLFVGSWPKPNSLTTSIVYANGPSQVLLPYTKPKEVQASQESPG